MVSAAVRKSTDSICHWYSTKAGCNKSHVKTKLVVNTYRAHQLHDRQLQRMELTEAISLLAFRMHHPFWLKLEAPSPLFSNIDYAICADPIVFRDWIVWGICLFNLVGCRMSGEEFGINQKSASVNTTTCSCIERDLMDYTNRF